MKKSKHSIAIAVLGMLLQSAAGVRAEQFEPALTETGGLASLSTGGGMILQSGFTPMGLRMLSSVPADAPADDPIFGVLPLPTPRLHLPGRLPINGELTLDYPNGDFPGIEFEWTATPKANASAGPASSPGYMSVVSQAPHAITFRTSFTNASLAGFGMDVGLHTFTVQAFAPGGRSSAKASQDVMLVSVAISGARAFPNPWRLKTNANTPVTFDGIPAGSEVKIFTVTGQWLKTLTAPNADWYVNNDEGQQVASGIYLYVIKSQGETKTGQIHIIK